MILRRPSQTDKEAILEMMAEFEREQSAHDGGFWNPDNFVYEELARRKIFNRKRDPIFLKTGFLLSSWFSFDEANHALWFSQPSSPIK